MLLVRLYVMLSKPDLQTFPTDPRHDAENGFLGILTTSYGVSSMHLNIRDGIRVPYRLRKYVRDFHRSWVFDRAMKKFLEDPELLTDPGEPTFDALIYGWGNPAWGATADFLADSIRRALQSPEAILECGSGLSTLLTGAVATRLGYPYWCLEHSPVWAATVQPYLAKYTISAVTLVVRPLISYGSYSWYDPPLSEMPRSFSLVLCDGPPRRTEGGRYGLMPVMHEHLHEGCIVLLDDADRDGEISISRRWRDDYNATPRRVESTRPYFVIEIGVPVAAVGAGGPEDDVLDEGARVEIVPLGPGEVGADDHESSVAYVLVASAHGVRRSGGDEHVAPRDLDMGPRAGDGDLFEAKARGVVFIRIVRDRCGHIGPVEIARVPVLRSGDGLVDAVGLTVVGDLETIAPGGVVSVVIHPGADEAHVSPPATNPIFDVEERPGAARVFGDDDVVGVVLRGGEVQRTTGYGPMGHGVSLGFEESGETSGICLLAVVVPENVELGVSEPRRREDKDKGQPRSVQHGRYLQSDEASIGGHAPFVK